MNSFWATSPVQNWTRDVVYVAWCCYISKIIDLLDTLMFVARKKQNQISFLHVWHHAIIVPSVWYFVKYLMGKSYFCNFVQKKREKCFQTL